MAYNEFAYFYDEFNGAADYQALYAFIHEQLRQNGIPGGIVADLGCGTGDLTLMLAQAGYDMIGIDRSEEMLSVLREKAEELGLGGKLLLLRQDLLQLDLFGTIRAAVSTFDTYNHIGPAENFARAIAQAAFFMEKDGIFIFDLNTPYKHREILANHTFDFAEQDAACHWENQYDPGAEKVTIKIEIRYEDTGETFREEFPEYSYERDYVLACLTQSGFAVQTMADGETFGPVQPDSQRWIFVCKKQYTQEKRES